MLRHHRKNNYLSLFDESEVDKIEQRVKDLNQQNKPPPPCTHPVTPTEIKPILDQLPPDKSPGVDCIPNYILQSGGKIFLLTPTFWMATE